MSTPPILPVSASAPVKPESLPAKRLIVLVSPDDVYEALLARRIWTMALHQQCEVLYVALARDADDELRARRSLALLASMTRDARLQVSTHLAFHSQWLTALRPLYQPGDAIVCPAEQTVKRLGRSKQPLSQQLGAELGGPVHALEGISVEQPGTEREAWPLIRDSVPYAIVVGFLGFQMWATAQLGQSAASQTSLALSVVLEFSLIWLWVSRVR